MFGTLRGFDIPLLEEFRRLQREVDDVFAGGAGHSQPRFAAVEVAANPQQVDLYLTAPGIDAKTLDISIQRNVLSVTGRRDAQVEGQATRHAQERFSGEFRQVITLPEDVDSNRVTASYVDGVVRISLQRNEAARPRQIQIH